MKVKSKFSIPYDNGGELEMRLYNTVIRYNDKPVIVTATGIDLDGKLQVTLKEYNGASFKKVYGADPLFDLSPLPPIYTHFRSDDGWDGNAYWLSRQAIRKYQQGGNSGNTKYRRVGRGEAVSPASPMNILAAYTFPQKVTDVKAAVENPNWEHSFAHALSVHVCVFREYDSFFGKFTGKIKVEYHGEVMGDLVKEEGVYILKTENESLSFNPWCVSRLEAVSIFVR